jgi:SAM-dependent methyltransferase
MNAVVISSLTPRFTIVCFLFFIFSFEIQAQSTSHHWDEYFQSQLHSPPEKFIISGLQKISGSGVGKTAIDLGSGVGHETKLLLQKGYKVIAVDGNPRALQYMQLLPGIQKYKPNLTTINTKFEKLIFKKLPQTDLVISSFALPFVPKREFNRVWQDIVASIKPGGYIIVNLFDPRFSFNNSKDQMTFHTKNQALALFANMKIVEFREMRNDPLKGGAANHYYVIIAKKIQ